MNSTTLFRAVIVDTGTKIHDESKNTEQTYKKRIEDQGTSKRDQREKRLGNEDTRERLKVMEGEGTGLMGKITRLAKK